MEILASLSLLLALGLFLRMARFHLLLHYITRAAAQLKVQLRTPMQQPRFVILVPAHNEEMGIAATIGSIHALDYPRSSYRLIVIADNCSDQTAKIARACGAEVLERSHATQRSKGYALEFAIQQIASEAAPPPDAVVVIDADTRVDRRLLQAFAVRLAEGDSWLQAYYSVSNPDDTWRTRLMTYAFSLFNGVWLAGQDQLGIGCSFRGNGMAFAWKALQSHPWSAYGLAEDLEFSWRLRSRGELIRFVPEARVYGEIVTGNAAAAKSQRLRWERGRAELKTSMAPALKAMPVSSLQRFVMLSDLWFPPLGRWFLLTAASLLLAALGTGLAWASPSALFKPIGMGLGGLLILVHIAIYVRFAQYLALPFRVLGLPLGYLKSLARAPLYLVWKAIISVSRSPSEWVRTDRNKN